MNKLPTIALPQGVRDILPAESAKIASTEARILELFSGYGFERVIPPILEFVEVLDLGLPASLKERMLKFIDPSTGQLVGLRPDITPQIARVAATRMRDCARPLKLSYSESIIRYIDPGGAKATEIRQLGVEYMTEEPSAAVDAELISVAIEALRSLKLEDFKIDIGDVGFVRAILAGLEVSDEMKNAIREALAIKDKTGLAALLGKEGAGAIDDEQSKVLLGLTSLHGSSEIIENAMGLAGLNDGAMAILKNLKEVVGIVSEKGLSDHITIDLGEVRGFDYYTGIIVEGFAGGVGRPILTGGRYDHLVERYGLKSAATGFAFDVVLLIEALK